METQLEVNLIGGIYWPIYHTAPGIYTHISTKCTKKVRHMVVCSTSTWIFTLYLILTLLFPSRAIDEGRANTSHSKWDIWTSHTSHTQGRSIV